MNDDDNNVIHHTHTRTYTYDAVVVVTEKFAHANQLIHTRKRHESSD